MATLASQTKKLSEQDRERLTKLPKEEVEASRNLVAPVYGWFFESFDTLDLKEAKSLLDELHA
jgi:hypothetical protein